MSELAVSLPSGYGVATYPPGATFGPRAMREYEFVWIIEGDAEYQWGDRTVAAPAGAVVLCRPGATDAFRWDRQRRTRHGYFHFQTLSLPDDWPTPDTWPLVRVPPPDDILRPLFRHLLTWHGHENERQTRLTVAHLLTSYVFGNLAAGSVGRAAWPEAVERACACIARALEDDSAQALPLARLADAACVSPEHLCRLFKTSLGHSPAETVRLARLDRAAGLLVRSNYSVGEISALCGFVSPFHFSRLFKRAFGRSPTQVRQDVRAGATAPLTRLLHQFPSSIG